MRLLAAILSLSFWGCPQTQPPQPPPAPAPMDAGYGQCDNACSNLATLGCILITDVDICGDACRVADGTLTDLKPGCLAAAKTQADARACGTVHCKRALGEWL